MAAQPASCQAVTGWAALELRKVHQLLGSAGTCRTLVKLVLAMLNNVSQVSVLGSCRARLEW